MVTGQGTHSVWEALAEGDCSQILAKMISDSVVLGEGKVCSASRCKWEAGSEEAVSVSSHRLRFHQVGPPSQYRPRLTLRMANA